jgi:hypothetical protein
MLFFGDFRKKMLDSAIFIENGSDFRNKPFLKILKSIMFGLIKYVFWQYEVESC